MGGIKPPKLKEEDAERAYVTAACARAVAPQAAKACWPAGEAAAEAIGLPLPLPRAQLSTCT